VFPPPLELPLLLVLLLLLMIEAPRFNGEGVDGLVGLGRGGVLEVSDSDEDEGGAGGEASETGVRGRTGGIGSGAGRGDAVTAE
jgi:hypothetical protein